MQYCAIEKNVVTSVTNYYHLPMNLKRLVFILLPIAMLQGCSRYHPLEVVKKLEISKYMGTWYEIARFPHSFENGLTCVTATYSMRKDGKIDVLNKGFTMVDDTVQVKTAHGVARIPDAKVPAKLEVRFFGPFYSNYEVMALGEHYEYALVGTPSREYLWILSRTPHISGELYNSLVNVAKNQGFDISQLKKIDQDCLQ